MLMTITLASQHHSFVGVWIGSSLGMVVADGLAIIAGRILRAQLPARLIKYGAAALFLVTGELTLIEAALNRTAPKPKDKIQPFHTTASVELSSRPA